MLPLNLFTAIALLATAVTAIPLPAQQQTTSILTFPLLDRSIPPTSPSITALQKRGGVPNRQAIYNAFHHVGTKVLPAKWVPPHRQLVPGVHTTAVGKKLSSIKASINAKLGRPARKPVTEPGWGSPVKGSTSNPPSPPPLKVETPKKATLEEIPASPKAAPVGEIGSPKAAPVGEIGSPKAAPVGEIGSPKKPTKFGEIEEIGSPKAAPEVPKPKPE